MRWTSCKPQRDAKATEAKAIVRWPHFGELASQPQVRNPFLAFGVCSFKGSKKPCVPKVHGTHANTALPGLFHYAPAALKAARCCALLLEESPPSSPSCIRPTPPVMLSAPRNESKVYELNRFGPLSQRPVMFWGLCRWPESQPSWLLSMRAPSGGRS